MLQQIDHVGIAVDDLDRAIAEYRQLLGSDPSHREVVRSDAVATVMFDIGPSRIELLGANGPDSRIARFLATRGPGLHHIAYRVADVQAALDHYAAQGRRLLDTSPRPGAGGRMIAFVHPAAAVGVLTELCSASERAEGGL